MIVKKAIRKATPPMIMLYGRSGSGKTYSALEMARGLISDEKRICVIDTENGRASHYAQDFDFDVLDLEPPFSPARYTQAINTILQDSKYGVIIIDSISHEWEGLGGCCDMADKIGEDLRKKGLSDKGLNVWAKPKSEHKKFSQNNLIRSKVPIILCARAKEELKQVKTREGKTEITNLGLVPIQEKNLPYEMLVMVRMEDGGKFEIEKWSNPALKTKLKAIQSEYINQKFGRAILEWVSGGEMVDNEVLKLKEEAREVAMTEGELALKSWFEQLSEEDRDIAGRFPLEFKKDLSRIARERDSLDLGFSTKSANIRDFKQDEYAEIDPNQLNMFNEEMEAKND